MLFSKMIRAAALTGLVMSVTVIPSGKDKIPVDKTQSFTYKYDGAITGGLLGMAAGLEGFCITSFLIGHFFTRKCLSSWLTSSSFAKVAIPAALCGAIIGYFFVDNQRAKIRNKLKDPNYNPLDAKYYKQKGGHLAYINQCLDEYDHIAWQDRTEKMKEIIQKLEVEKAYLENIDENPYLLKNKATRLLVKDAQFRKMNAWAYAELPTPKEYADAAKK